MIIIADAHVSRAAQNDGPFFEMLQVLSANDQDLVFLGDIFDLWIALPRYEQDIHRRFAAWCREQKKYRQIGFMEGNHEYFLTDEMAATFTWCSREAWWRDTDGTVYVHGDQINRRDKNYLAFRRLVKNPVAKFLLRWLPLGPGLANFFKHELKKTNAEFRRRLPRKQIEHFANTRFAEGTDSIFVGHFHQPYHYCRPDDKALYVVPDWFSTRKVTVYHRDPRRVEFVDWQRLEV